jgi:hypothetical protein
MAAAPFGDGEGGRGHHGEDRGRGELLRTLTAEAESPTQRAESAI